jgi:ubiquinone/menaquinone biosynthesis C-methylase UbiE
MALTQPVSNIPERDSIFAGPVPEVYDRYLVPLIFEPYARDVVSIVANERPSRVLEIAAGSGVVTRELSRRLPDAAITASDLNQAMLDHARRVGTDHTVEWQRADATNLPFEDEAFDVVVCQFGAMFFPDKPKAFSEARRVLKTGGAFVFNTWNTIETNEFANVVTIALAKVFPEDPPRFMARTPHGYSDPAVIVQHVSSSGFGTPEYFETVTHRSRAASALIPAIAYCQGTPLRDEICARDPARLDEATRAAEDAVRSAFGDGEVDGRIEAHVIVARKS